MVYIFFVWNTHFSYGFFHVFLSRNSVAVDPAFAQCTNRCTRRKVTVNAQPTNRENRNLKKTRRHENSGYGCRDQSSHPKRERIKVHSLRRSYSFSFMLSQIALRFANPFIIFFFFIFFSFFKTERPRDSGASLGRYNSTRS